MHDMSKKDIKLVAKDLGEHLTPALEKLISYIGQGERCLMIVDYKNVSKGKDVDEFNLRGRISIIGAEEGEALHQLLTPLLDIILKDADGGVSGNLADEMSPEQIEKEWREGVTDEPSVDDILKLLPKFEAS